MSLKKKTFWGAIWNSLSSVSLTGVNFVITAILARLLSPNAFGLMGMIQTAIVLINMMNQFGLGPAIIQGKNLNQDRLSSLFWFNMLIGLIMSVFVYFSSSLISAFFGEPELIFLLKLISMVFFIVSIAFVQQNMLKKEMRFKELFNINLISTILYGVITIIFALQGLGAKALVLGYISKNIIKTAIIIIFYRWFPNFHFNYKAIKDLINFGLYNFGARVLNYFNSNLDYLLIGRFLGSEALGYYTLAYKLMLVPLSKISGVISNTFLPAFSEIKNKIGVIKKYYLEILSLLSLITFPMMGGLFVVAPEFILSIYGSDWSPVIIIVQILCIAGAGKSLGTTMGIILLSQGRADIEFKWNIFALVVYSIAIFTGINWGIIGVAYGVTIYSLLIFWIAMYVIGSVINTSLIEIFNSIKKSFLYTAMMMLTVYLFRKIITLPNIESLPIQLIINVVVGVIAYSIFILTIDGKKYSEKVKRIKKIM